MSVVDKEVVATSYTQPILVPKLTPVGKVSSHKWKRDYLDNIKCITNDLLETVIQMKDDHYMVHVSIDKLQQSLADVLYERSANALKSYQRNSRFM